jgi:acetyl esterase/lipase
MELSMMNGHTPRVLGPSMFFYIICEEYRQLRIWKAFFIAACLILSSQLLPAQTSNVADWTAGTAARYQISPDQVFEVASGTPLKLDVWEAQTTELKSTVIYFHGGGWIFGDRTGATTLLLPWLQFGWNVVNVEYRMANVALAPAAVLDVRCALRWVYRNSAKFRINTKRIVVTGHSAGGHLALMAGMATPESELDDACPADPKTEQPLKVAAIVNWYGITDVADLLQGPDLETYAVQWLGGQTGKAEVARRVSPLSYVRPGLPPIITVHGDHDPTVPYSQAVRFHRALEIAHVPNQLVTIPGGPMGNLVQRKTSTHINRFLNSYMPGFQICFYPSSQLNAKRSSIMPGYRP